MKQISFLSLLLLLFVFASCDQGKKKDTSSTSNEVTEQTTQNTSDFKKGTANLPSIPKEMMQKLWDQCEFVDYIFYELPFSMSQTEQPSIRANLNYVGTGSIPGVPSTCKAIGREFFQINGEIVMEAEVYFSQECRFYIFFEDGKPKYSNKMSPDGEKFYNQMITQALEMRKNGIQ